MKDSAPLRKKVVLLGELREPIPIFATKWLEIDNPDPNRAFDPSETEVAQQLLKEKEQAIRAGLTAEYNSAISRFSTGYGTDLAAPDKATFRKSSHQRGQTWA